LCPGGVGSDADHLHEVAERETSGKPVNELLCLPDGHVDLEVTLRAATNLSGPTTRPLLEHVAFDSNTSVIRIAMIEVACAERKSITAEEPIEIGRQFEKFIHKTFLDVPRCFTRSITSRRR
jgi:hypothetical protein